MIFEAILLTALSVPRITQEISVNTENIHIEVPTINIEEKPTAPTKPERTPYPTATPKPAAIAKPTETPKPSKTPRPTRTPKPSTTSKPTAIKTPAPTPKPTVATQPATGINQQSVLQALNIYRQKNGIQALILDPKLQTFAQSRADFLKSNGKLDNHAGFTEYIKNQDGFNKLGFNAIAENQSWNYKGSGTGLIEDLYGKSSGHNKNQLNSLYTHVGIGVSGVYTNLVFGGRKR